MICGSVPSKGDFCTPKRVDPLRPLSLLFRRHQGFFPGVSPSRRVTLNTRLRDTQGDLCYGFRDDSQQQLRMGVDRLAVPQKAQTNVL